MHLLLASHWLPLLTIWWMWVLEPTILCESSGNHKERLKSETFVEFVCKCHPELRMCQPGGLRLYRSNEPSATTQYLGNFGDIVSPNSVTTATTAAAPQSTRRVAVSPLPWTLSVPEISDDISVTGNPRPEPEGDDLLDGSGLVPWIGDLPKATGKKPEPKRSHNALPRDVIPNPEYNYYYPYYPQQGYPNYAYSSGDDYRYSQQAYPYQNYPGYYTPEYYLTHQLPYLGWYYADKYAGK